MKIYVKRGLILFAIISFCGISNSECWAQDLPTERVAFKKGTSSATVEGSISGRETLDYLLNVGKGQQMNISMASENSGIYFNIMEPGELYEAIYNGSVNGNQFEGTTDKSGDYRIRVYLMKGAQNSSADYRLEMIVD